MKMAGKFIDHCLNRNGVLRRVPDSESFYGTVLLISTGLDLHIEAGFHFSNFFPFAQSVRNLRDSTKKNDMLENG